MANTIIHKNSSVAGKIPLVSDLTAGELAVNTSDAKLYIKNTAGDVVAINGLINSYVVKAANYTATTKEAVVCQTGTAAITVTLPATPNVNDAIKVIDVDGNASINNITIARNGNNIMGLAQNMTISTNNVGTYLVYVDVTYGWIIG